MPSLLGRHCDHDIRSLTESPLFPLDDTLAVMRTMGRVRAAIGVTYPVEVEARPDERVS